MSIILSLHIFFKILDNSVKQCYKCIKINNTLKTIKTEASGAKKEPEAGNTRNEETPETRKEPETRETPEARERT